MTEVVLSMWAFPNIKVKAFNSDTVKVLVDDWGNGQCPFCDSYIQSEGNVVKVGDKCWKCQSEIISIE